jgi:amidase/6-aminohexanoate-cyclic-dimer hydrolase
MVGLKNTAKLLETLGHTVEEAGPNLDGDALGDGMVKTICAAMAATFEARSLQLGREMGENDFEPITMHYIRMGQTTPGQELYKANHAFQTAALTFDRFMTDGGYDLVLAPTLSRQPEVLGVLSLDPKDFKAYGEAVSTFAPWCAPFNQMGAPAMSVPLHWTDDDLPLGMMFGARYGNERLLFQLAGQLERAAPWADKRPPVWVGDL